MSDDSGMSPEVEQDYDALLEPMMDMIEKWLQEQDGFIPCGAAMTMDGEVAGHMAGTDDSDTMEDVMRLLFEGLRKRAEAGEIRASIVCYDGGFHEDDEFVPSIVTILEHIQGPALIAYRPYRKGADGTYEYAQTEAHLAEPETFAGL